MSDASTDVAALPTRPEEWVAGKNRYKPPGDPFPQIIQGDDYSAISAIHELYFLLAGRKKSLDAQTFAFDLNGTQLVIKSPTRSVSVLSMGEGAKVGASLYKNAPSRVLFKTLMSLLVDLSTQFRPSGVRARYRSTRTYPDQTSFEFYFPPLVVELAAASTSATEPERLYILDLVWAKDSEFWTTEGE